MATENKEPTTHKLKSWPESFRAAASGRKRFEVRRDDRNFRPGDIVELLEWDPFDDDGDAPSIQSRGFTGRTARFFVGYVERSAALPPGWCGFQLVTGDDINRVALAMGRPL